MEWPSLAYEEWKPTYETLHRWVQIIGKLRLCKSPWVNHSWGSTLYVSSFGFTTSAIPLKDRNLTIELNLIHHKITFDDSFGLHHEFPLQEESAASFYQRFMDALKMFEVTPTFSPHPNEVMDATAFDKDEAHCTYNKKHAENCFQVLVRINNILQDFRADFLGKSSPVHFFWGSFDLAVTRFSGRRAPEHPGGIPHLSDDVVKEAYSHEVMSCGFWPGNEMYPKPAFYAYAYPEPAGFSKSRILPQDAYYHPDLHEYILDYDKVRNAINPEAVLRTFFDSCYRAAANLGNWDREILEVSPHLIKVKDHFHLSRSSAG